jgi:hypothetical protein
MVDRGAIMRVTRISIMKQLFAALCAVALLAAATPAFAQQGTGRGTPIGAARAPLTGTGIRALQSRIPAPLPAPAQPPVINGPLSPSGLPPMGLTRSQ